VPRAPSRAWSGAAAPELCPEQTRWMNQRGLEYAYSEVQLVIAQRRSSSKRPVRGILCALVKRPDPVVDHWKDDTEFAGAHSGGRSMVIRMVRSTSEIPGGRWPPEREGKSLEELIVERRLFILVTWSCPN